MNNTMAYWRCHFALFYPLGFIAILLLGLTLLTAAYLYNGILNSDAQPLWIMEFYSLPGAVYLSTMTLYLAAAWWSRKTQNTILINSLCVALIGILYLSLQTIAPMGDYRHWINQAVLSKDIWLSEPLANAIYYFVAQTWGSIGALATVPPIFGMATLFCYLLLARVMLKKEHGDNFLLQLYFPSTGIAYLYFYNYIENPFLGGAFFLLFLFFSIRYLQTPPANGCRYILIAGVMLTLALLTHGVYTFLLPAIPLIIFYNRLSPSNWDLKGAFTDLILCSFAMALCAFFCYALLWMVDLNIISGNIHGGADGLRFVALESGGKYYRHSMFSFSHISEVANIVIHSAPGLLLLIPLLGYLLYKKEAPRLIELKDESIAVVLAISSLGYLSFIFLWNFDLGMPKDLDLMLAMGAPLNLFVFYLLYSLAPKPKCTIMLSVLLGIYLNASFFSRFLINRIS